MVRCASSYTTRLCRTAPHQHQSPRTKSSPCKQRGLAPSKTFQRFTKTKATTFRRRRTQLGSFTRTAKATCFSSQPRLASTNSGPRPRRRCPILWATTPSRTATRKTVDLRSMVARASRIACTRTTRSNLRAASALPWGPTTSPVPPLGTCRRSSTLSGTSAATMVRCASSRTTHPCPTQLDARKLLVREGQENLSAGECGHQHSWHHRQCHENFLATNLEGTPFEPLCEHHQGQLAEL